MDFNIVVLAGHLAAEPEIRTFPSGATLVRYLVTVRSTAPMRRVDVIPVTLWDPDEAELEVEDVRGRPIYVAGAVQRRFWSVDAGKSSRVEVVAHHVEVRDAVEPEGDEERVGA